MRILFLAAIFFLLQACTNEVKESEEGYKIPFGIINEEMKDVEDDEYRYSIQLNGKDIYRQQYGVVNVEKVFVLGDTSYIVISYGEGAIACPNFFRVLEVQSKDRIIVSEEFGSCSDIADVKERSGTIIVKMPDYIPHPDLLNESERKERESTTYEYRYENGKILETKHSS